MFHNLLRSQVLAFLYPFYSRAWLSLMLFTFFWSFCISPSFLMYFSAQRNILCGHQCLSTIFRIRLSFTEILWYCQELNLLSPNGRCFGINSSYIWRDCLNAVGFFWEITAPLLYTECFSSVITGAQSHVWLNGQRLFAGCTLSSCSAALKCPNAPMVILCKWYEQRGHSGHFSIAYFLWMWLYTLKLLFNLLLRLGLRNQANKSLSRQGL